MRQLATLPDAEARKLADHLLTLKIETQLEQEPGGWAVWVRDEDRLPQARQELEEFRRNPSDPRFTRAAPVAEDLRRKEVQAERDYARRQFDLRQRWSDLGGRIPLTYVLIGISVLVGVFSGSAFSLSGSTTSPLLERLYIASFKVEDPYIVWDGLQQIAHGQVWRLVTPIFIHFGPIHLLFNMAMLYSLGGAVEVRRGTGRYLLLVLLLAVLSNLAQYYWGDPDFKKGTGLVFRHSPLFGGMSGVLYGLFGYVWMKSRFEPGLGLAISPGTVFYLMAWFVLCLAGAIGNVANMAHAAGLVVGIAVGYAPTLLRSLRGRQ